MIRSSHHFTILQSWLVILVSSALYSCSSAFLQNHHHHQNQRILHQAKPRPKPKPSFKPSCLYDPSSPSSSSLFLTRNTADSHDEGGASSEDESDDDDNINNINNNDDDDDDGNPNVPARPVVTKEMFLRDLLRDPADNREPDAVSAVQKKRQKGPKDKDQKVQKGQKVKEYRATLDNRDSLPFAVQVTTPDPYTHPDTKEKLARSNTNTNTNQQVLPNRRRRHDAIEQSSLVSSVYTNNKGGGGNKNKSKNNKSDKDGAAAAAAAAAADEDYTTKLGEFALDKHTATGDLLHVGDVQYKVVRLKCQYKYSGGGRFVMVRKILQVKEVGRLETEESLARLWNQQQQSSSSSTSSRDDDDDDNDDDDVPESSKD
jgi:hypothetical protein